MLTHKKLKIWTIILHGLILIAAGHGVVPFFLMEAMYVFNRKVTDLSFSFSANNNHFAVAGLTALLGQVLITISLFIIQQQRKLLFHIPGLCMLWLSVVYVGYDAANHLYIHMPWFTVVPFLICTILTFTGQYLKRAYYWLGEHL